MRRFWKALGIAGIVGVAATGVVVARRRRAAKTYTPEELRRRLHQRLAETGATRGNGSAPDAPKLRT
ncbi:MAG TPA: hypothetical protein VKA65_15885 [Acidimicrobiales bacterium]|jgi:hypothetical protein|nr:hypothetical protein [Acidimicrobiales bacterium]